MNPQDIIEITFTKKAIGFGFTANFYWENICIYLPFVSIVYNYSQQKLKDNKYVDIKIITNKLI